MKNILGNKRSIVLPGGNYTAWCGGKGPLVVLLHGWPVTSFHWRYLIPFLNAAGFETVAIDLKGLGESSSSDRIFEKAILAAELFQVIAALRPGVSTFSVIGHDWGGSLAIAMTVLESEKVSHLIVEDEVAPGMESPLEGLSRTHYPTWHGGFHRTQGLAEQLIRGNEERYIEYFLNLRAKPDSLPKKDRDYYSSQYANEKKTKDALAYYRSYAQDAEFFQRIEKHPIEIPTLAIAGNYGMGTAVFSSIKRIAKNVTAVFLESSGHYPAEEESKAFNQKVVRFLKKVS
jgi:pimeloyl-ACP methyl ester carboxylesterase